MFASRRTSRSAQAGDTKSPATPAQQVDAATLRQRFGNSQLLQISTALPNSPLLSGNFAAAKVRQGMRMHCTDFAHLQDMHTRHPHVEPSVKVLLRLEGSAEVKLGGRLIDLEAGQGADSRPRGAVVTVCETVDFERRCHAGIRERMVSITLEPEWFLSAGLHFPQQRGHLSILPWQPSPRCIAIAEQLIRPAEIEGSMHSLLQESRALELIAEALGQTEGSDFPSPGLPPASYRRLERLRQLLDSGEADQLEMAAIAQRIGCNPTTLQQQFRQAFGLSIFEYLREKRLLRAARALQEDGVSVAYAAEIAGYASQANFSTAFRRKFGLSPKHFRLRIQAA